MLALYVFSQNAKKHEMSAIEAYEYLIALQCTDDSSAKLCGFESYITYHNKINDVTERMNSEMSRKEAAKLRLKVCRKRWIAQCRDFNKSVEMEWGEPPLQVRRTESPAPNAPVLRELPDSQT